MSLVNDIYVSFISSHICSPDQAVGSCLEAQELPWVISPICSSSLWDREGHVLPPGTLAGPGNGFSSLSLSPSHPVYPALHGAGVFLQGEELGAVGWEMAGMVLGEQECSEGGGRHLSGWTGFAHNLPAHFFLHLEKQSVFILFNK